MIDLSLCFNERGKRKVRNFKFSKNENISQRLTLSIITFHLKELYAKTYNIPYAKFLYSVRRSFAYNLEYSKTFAIYKQSIEIHNIQKRKAKQIQKNIITQC